MPPEPYPDAPSQPGLITWAQRTVLAVALIAPLVVGLVLWLPRFQDDIGFLQERRYGSPKAAEQLALLIGAICFPAMATVGMGIGRFWAPTATARWYWNLFALGMLVLQDLVLLTITIATPNRIQAHRFMLWGTLALIPAAVMLHRRLGSLRRQRQS